MKKVIYLIFTLFTILGVNAHEGHTTASNSFPFVENKGQWPQQVNFRAEIDGATVYFQKNAFHYQFLRRPNFHANVPAEDDTLEIGHVFEAEFLNANVEIEFSKEEQSSFYFNYFLGNDESKWQSFVYSYNQIKYHNLYDGIDLSVYSYQNTMKYDYHIAAGKDPNQIQIAYKGVDRPKLTDGNLIISHNLGDLIEEKPYAYQIEDGKELEVKCNYVIHENGTVSFEFPNGYNKALELIIDPIVFSTYSGSRSGNFGATATYDTLGFAYMGGTIFSGNYNNVLGGFQTTYGGGDADIAISKFNRDGSQLVYSTFLGGSGTDVITSMVVDHNLNLVILGTTSSSNYPTTSTAFDRQKDNSLTVLFSNGYGWDFIGGSDIVITKFNLQGSSLLGSTYLGGNAADGINYNRTTPDSRFSNDDLVYNYGDHFRGEVVVDNSNNIYIGSCTRSTNLPNAVNNNQGGLEGIVAKFNPNLSQLNWLRYHGGNNSDAIYSLKLLSNNRILVGGGTESASNFPVVVPAYQTTRRGGRADGFLAIISNDGLTLNATTFIGTNSYDQVYFVEADRFGGVYAFGQTNSSNFPLLNTSIADNSGQFIVKLDSNLNNLLFSHTFGDTLGTGGVINMSPTAFLVDRCQNIYISGWGGSLFGSTTEGPKVMPSSMRITNNSGGQSTTGDGDAFYIYAVNRDLDSVLFATFYGDPTSDDHVDGGTSRFDKEGVVYQSICASCLSPNPNGRLPTTPNSYAPNKNVTVGSNDCNNALLKYDLNILPESNFSITKTRGCEPYLATIIDSSARASEVIWELFGNRFTFGKDTSLVFDSVGTFVLKQFARDTICDAIDSSEVIIEVYPNAINVTTSSDTITCNQDSINITAFSNGSGKEFVWSSNIQFTDTLNATEDSSLKVKPEIASTTYYIIVTDTANNDCERIDSVRVQYVPFDVSLVLSSDTSCINSPVNLNSTSTNVDDFTWHFGDGRTNTTNANPTISYASQGTYTVKLIGTNNSCQVTDSSDLQIEILPNNLSLVGLPDSIYCGLDSVHLIEDSKGTAQTFLWSSSRNFLDTLNNYPLDSSISFGNAVSDTFYVKINDRFCSLIEKTFLEYNPFDLDLGFIPDSGCTPFIFELNPQLLGATNFEIDFDNGLGTTTDRTPEIIYNTDGRFTIEMIGENNRCNRSDTLRGQIEILENVQLQAMPDSLICLGDTIELIGNSFGTANEFYWDTSPNFNTPLNPLNDSNIIVSPNGNQRFYLKGEYFICRDEISLLVETEEVIVDVSDLESICFEDSLTIQAQAIQFNSPLYYSWSPFDSIISGASTNTILVAPKGNILYTLITTSDIGCQDFDTTEVDVQLPAFTDAIVDASNDSLYRGEIIQLGTNRNGSNLVYFWEPAGLLDNPNSPTPNSSPTTDTTFKVTITDLNTGCEVIAYKKVKVFEINCDEPDVFIPSAFSPNGDGMNDVFLLRANYLAEIDLEIYNRWGELVFQTQNINEGWDGTYQGKEVDPDVFVYHLTVKCLDNQEYYTQGNVTVIR